MLPFLREAFQFRTHAGWQHRLIEVIGCRGFVLRRGRSRFRHALFPFVAGVFSPEVSPSFPGIAPVAASFPKVGYATGVAGVAWLGYDRPRSLGERETGGGLALPIWIDYLKDVLPDVPQKEHPVDALVVDTAHGHSKAEFEFIKRLLPS